MNFWFIWWNNAFLSCYDQTILATIIKCVWKWFLYDNSMCFCMLLICLNCCLEGRKGQTLMCVCMSVQIHCFLIMFNGNAGSGWADEGQTHMQTKIQTHLKESNIKERQREETHAILSQQLRRSAMSVKINVITDYIRSKKGCLRQRSRWGSWQIRRWDEGVGGRVFSLLGLVYPAGKPRDPDKAQMSPTVLHTLPIPQFPVFSVVMSQASWGCHVLTRLSPPPVPLLPSLMTA